MSSSTTDAVVSAWRLSGLDTRAPRGPEREHLSAPSRPLIESEALTDLLYTRWFCRIDDRPVDAPRSVHSARFQPSLSARLRAAHAATGRFDTGWRVSGVGSRGTVSVDRGGESLVVSPPDYIGAERPTVPVSVGDAVDVTARRDGLDATGAWWVTVGSAGPVLERHMIRVYWNCPPFAVAELVGRLTRMLEHDATRYTLKCPAAPEWFDRVDAVVLYVALEDWKGGRRELGRIHALVESHLRPAVPPLTLRLGRGVAVAEDPGGDLSFGQSRTRLVAEGLLKAHLAGESAPEALIEAVGDRFAADGLDLGKPYLRPSSVVRRELRW